MPDRVAVYVRWSTDEQSDGTTLEVQLEACRLFIRSQGWMVREDLLFVDEGFSGATLDRPGLTALRRAVQEGGVDCVVVYKLDRLSRSVLDTVNLVLEEWDGLCAVRSAREPIDTANPTGAVFFYLLASYAEWERSTIRERTMSGKIKRAQQGRNPGFALPYGYRKGGVPGEIAADEGEAVVVRRIFREYIAGRGAQAIADGLNRDGVRPRRARLWTGYVVSQMIGNPVYTGVLRYGLSAVASKAQRRQLGRGRLAFVEPLYACVQGAFPALVSDGEFARAEQVRRRRQAIAGSRARGARFLLSGLVRCRCGATVRGDGRPAQRVRYYRCSGGGCSAGLMPARQVETAVWERVRAVLAPDLATLWQETWQQDGDRHIRELQSERQRVHRALERTAKTRERLAADYEAGELPAALYAAHVERLDREERSLRATAEVAAIEQSTPVCIPVNDEPFCTGNGGVDLFSLLEPAEQKQVLVHVVERCTAYRAARGARSGSPQPIEIDLHLRMA